MPAKPLPPPRTSVDDAAGTTAPQGNDARPQSGCRVQRTAKVAYWFALVATVAMLVAGGSEPVAGGRASAPALLVHSLAPLNTSAATETGGRSAESAPLFVQHFFESVPAAPSVHASTIAQLPNGDLVAAWFGGTREGAQDVALYASNWDADSGRWEPVRMLSERAQSSRELGRYVKKLGNPVLHCDRNGRLWLYYVTVSVGGWSGGSVSVKHSDDQGRSWSNARRLIAAPFLNTCNLVRSTPIELEDGGVLLPTYHEFLYQFGELLHLDAEGQVVAKYRMNAGRDSLQPPLVARSTTELFAYHRRGGASQPKLLFNRSLDAGRSWSPVQTLELANPNASVAAVPTENGEVLMALNPSESGREQLALATSADGEDWQLLTLLEDGDSGQEFSYPSLVRGPAGLYHLSYTWDRTRICHVMFNDAWLETIR